MVMAVRTLAYRACRTRKYDRLTTVGSIPSRAGVIADGIHDSLYRAAGRTLVARQRIAVRVPPPRTPALASGAGGSPLLARRIVPCLEACEAGAVATLENGSPVT
jgi:hypothetical protein